jgi:hypothetical protein
MSESTTAGERDLGAIWDQVTNVIKERVLMPTLWRAMEHGQPVICEEGLFVVGFPVEQSYESHLLHDSRYKNQIEQTLESVAGEPLTLRVIHGTSLEDWRQVQFQEREAQRLRAPRQAPATEDTGWDGLSERLVRRYAATASRQLASIQAEFLEQCVEEIAAVYLRLWGEGGGDEEAQHRAYTRVLERLADRLGVPGAVIGYLVLQRRRQLESGPGA